MLDTLAAKHGAIRTHETPAQREQRKIMMSKFGEVPATYIYGIRLRMAYVMVPASWCTDIRIYARCLPVMYMRMSYVSVCVCDGACQLVY